MFWRTTVSFLACVLILGGQLPTLRCSAATPRRPNVVIFLADDQGWGDLSVHGNTNLSTPHLDSLARDGARFEQFFVCSVCAPTRAEFLTGRYHPRGGVRGVSTGLERLNVDERTVAEAFQQAGYATAAFGKWHNGTQGAYHPRARGFDEYYGFTSGHWGHYFDPILEHNGKIVRGEGFIIDDLTNHAIDFIQQHKDRPFFCYLPYNTPHSPFQVPDEYWNRFQTKSLALRHRDPEKEDLDTTRCALAMCENIDWNVGRVLQKLDDLQLTQNTIVLYFSDNGPNSWRWNAGMKGRKGSTDEGGLRSPLLIRWPGRIPSGTVVSQIAGAIDLLPTLVDLTGIPRVGAKPLDGLSLRPLLEQTRDEWPERMLFSHQNGQVSVRTQQHRLDASGRLYELTADPGQTRDVSKEHPEIAAELRQAVAAWKTEVLPPEEDDRPFPVGGSEFPVTFLPARDGLGFGNVKRSGGAPNCSFFTNWTSTDDRITWDVEVDEAGVFQVEIYYTCPDKDIGSTVELHFGDRRIVSEVTEAHDPPLYGMEADRVERQGESYVKDFRALMAGEIALPQGRAPLTLRALSVPGAQVMDVRGIVLTRTQALQTSAQDRQPVSEPVDPLPRLLILGDSISIGYTPHVRELLRGKVDVQRPAENCGPTTRGLQRLDAWLGEGSWDVIHFNFGLHDLKYINEKGQLVPPDQGATQVPLAEYEANLERIVRRLQKTGAKLIWCTTTPVPAGAAGRTPGNAAQYNDVADRVMRRCLGENYAVDDLYGFAADKLSQIQRPANVHFTTEGSQRLAERVVEVVLKELNSSE